MRNSKPTCIGNGLILALTVVTVLGNSLCWAQEKADSSKYLDAVREFAGNVLNCAWHNFQQMSLQSGRIKAPKIETISYGLKNKLLRIPAIFQ